MAHRPGRPRNRVRTLAPVPEIPPRLQEFTQHIAYAEYRTVLEIVGEGRTPAKVQELHMNALSWGDHLMATGTTTVACRAGCWFCCMMPVIVTPIEALGIAAWLDAHYDVTQRATLMQRLHERVMEEHEESLLQRNQAQRPCVFLQNGQCSIYSVRPLKCRGYTSPDRDACERNYRDPVHTPVVNVNAYHKCCGDAMLVGIVDGLQAAGIPAPLLDLTTAVRTALTTPNAAQRYMAGEPIFAGAEISP